MNLEYLQLCIDNYKEDPELFQDYINGLKDKMGIPGEFEGASWKNFNLSFNPGNKPEYAVIKDFSEHFNIEAKRDLFITGNLGTGKTRLIIQAGLDLIQKGIPVYFINQAFLNRRIRDLRQSEGRDEGNTSRARYNVLKKVHVLIIDDLGKGNMTPEIIEYTSDLIEERIHEGYVTFITTNFSYEELEMMFLPSTIDRIRDLP